MQNYNLGQVCADFLSEPHNKTVRRKDRIISGTLVVETQTSCQNPWNIYTTNNDRSKDALVIADIDLAAYGYEN